MTTQKKILANRINSAKGGIAYAKKIATEYEDNPSFCKNCNSKLPQKKRNNKFCSQSCAATFNNTGRQKTPRYKCLNCDNTIFKGKYCSIKCSAEHHKKYKSLEESLTAKRAIVREISANYRAKIKNQTPEDADRIAIKEFYSNCPLGYEVDHIIPISKGGLHTLDNLQYLTIAENRRKSNKIISGAPSGT